MTTQGVPEQKESLSIQCDVLHMYMYTWIHIHMMHVVHMIHVLHTIKYMDMDLALQVFPSTYTEHVCM